MTNIKSWIYLSLLFTIIVLPDWIEIFIVNIPIKIAIGNVYNNTEIPTINTPMPVKHNSYKECIFQTSYLRTVSGR